MYKLLPALLLCAAPMGAAFAQAVGPAQVRTATPAAERATTEAPLFNPAQLSPEAFETGRGDLFVLVKRDIFSLRAEIGGGVTSNAFLSDDNRKTDPFTRQRVSLSADTVIAGAYGVGVSVNFDASQFHNYNVLGSNAVGLRTYVMRPVSGTTIGISAGVSTLYDDSLDAHVLDQGDLHLIALRGFALGEMTQLTLSGAIGYLRADPEDYSHLRGFAEAAVQVAPMEGLELTGYLNATGRRYEDYFSSVFAESRRDLTGQLGVRVRYMPHANMILSAEFSVASNASTIDTFDYVAAEGSGQIGLAIRF